MSLLVCLFFFFGNEKIYSLLHVYNIRGFTFDKCYYNWSSTYYYNMKPKREKHAEFVSHCPVHMLSYTNLDHGVIFFTEIFGPTFSHLHSRNKLPYLGYGLKGKTGKVLITK